MFSPRYFAFLLIVLVGCTGAGGSTGIGVATSFNIRIVPPEERVEAPVPVGEMLAGEPVTAEELRGKVVVVNFWGSWCGPCREEQPRLEALWKRSDPASVRFIGVNTRRDQRAAALAFLEEFDVTYPSIYDPTSAIADDYGVRFMPATFVLDGQGRIVAQIIGAVRSADELQEIIDAERAR